MESNETAVKELGGFAVKVILIFIVISLCATLSHGSSKKSLRDFNCFAKISDVMDEHL